MQIFILIYKCPRQQQFLITNLTSILLRRPEPQLTPTPTPPAIRTSLAASPATLASRNASRLLLKVGLRGIGVPPMVGDPVRAMDRDAVTDTAYLAEAMTVGIDYW